MNNNILTNLVNSLIHSNVEKDFYRHKGDFLDEFYRSINNKDFKFPSEEPEGIRELPVEISAWIAGMVHYLCNKYNIEKPDWIFDDYYFLDEPFFGLNPPKGRLKGLVFANTPHEMRMRNIFTLPSTFTRV